MKQLILSLCVSMIATLCTFNQAVAQETATKAAATSFEIVAKLDKGPGNITVTPAGDIIMSLHQFFQHDVRVASIDDKDQLIPFAAAANLNSVLGLQADTNGVVWLLDNAMREGKTRRLVGWDTAKQQVVNDIDLSNATIDRSFINDLAVDSARNTIYIADPTRGAEAAIIVVDVAQGKARRVLQGHNSVMPEDIDLIVDGKPLRIRMDDGSEIRPRVGINPIALDKDGEWLYYGPMHGHSMYRIRTADLRNAALSAAALAAKVERWSDKPSCDGISIDDAGNLYLGDLANNAIGVISPDRQYRVLMSDPQLSWVDAFSFGNDGYLYAVVNQLHRTAVLNGGESIIKPPYLIVKFKPLAGGIVGR